MSVLRQLKIEKLRRLQAKTKIPKGISDSIPEAFKGIKEPHRYTVFHGGRGSAKSHSVARYLIDLSLEKPTKFLCTREFQNSINDSVHKLLSDIIDKENLHEWLEVKSTEIVGRNGSSFIFKGLAHNIESIKSIEGVDICWVEEAEKVSQRSWDILIPTVRKESSRFIITFNPHLPSDPTYKKFIEHPPPDALVRKVTWADNPYFPEVLRLEMEHLKRVDYDQYLHVWEGHPMTHSDALIFKGKFVVEEFTSSPNEHFRLGTDWGFANDAQTLIQSYVKGQTLFIEHEAYGHGIELSELESFFYSIPNSRHLKIWADNSRPETISFMKNLGWNIEAAPKWSGSVEDGIAFMRSFDKIVIHPRCKNTIKEFETYTYKIDKRTNEIMPVVVDENNHCIDAIRYSLSNLIKRKVTIYDSGFF